MVIIPTEKQFDWSHAPIVLFAVSLLNILIFFLYQSGDIKKSEDAIQLYEKNNYLQLEWQEFQKYLEEREEIDLLDEVEYLYQQKDYYSVSATIIARLDFYEHLNENAIEIFGMKYEESWVANRNRINSEIKQISFFKFGILPNDLQWHTLLTHQFFHGDFLHLFGNLFFLVICGFAVEAALGHLKFLIFYLISGAAGGFLHMIVDPSSASPLIGASGSISGVMAMYLGIFRFKKIEFFYWFFVFVGYFRAPALAILPFYIGKELFDFYTNTSSNVAFMAHTGGFIAGAALMTISLVINPKVVNQEYVEEDQRSDPRQEKLALVYGAIEKFRFDQALIELNEFISQFGSNFEFEYLKYNLSMTQNKQDTSDILLEILKFDKPTLRELGKLEKLWLDFPNKHKITALDKLKIGMSFCNLPNPSTAESLFSELVKRKVNPANLGVFARKLSVAHEKLKNFDKKNAYENFAEKALENKQS